MTNAAGTAIANPTPVQIGVLQECQGDLSFDSKTLYGAYEMPVAFGRGKGKFDFKAKFANFSYQALASLFFGNTATAALLAVSVNEAHTIPTTPYQVTITPPSSGTWTVDLGVQYTATGIALTRVASGPTTGQYSVAAGVYTFAAADTTLGVQISYEYSATSTTQWEVPFANQLMGQAPSFLAELSLPYNGKQLTIHLNNCVSSKFSIPFKNEDFSVSDFDFMALADASNNIGTYAFG